MNLIFCFHLDPSFSPRDFLIKNLSLLGEIDFHLNSEDCCRSNKAHTAACFYISEEILLSKKFLAYLQNYPEKICDEIKYFDYGIENSENIIKLPAWSPIRFWAVDYLGPVIEVPSRYMHSIFDADREYINSIILKDNLKVIQLKILSGTVNHGLPMSQSNRPIPQLLDIFDSKKITAAPASSENTLILNFSETAPSKISIVIPTAGKFNGNKTFVQECVESIASQTLDQSKIELIIVYDTKNNLDFLESIKNLSTPSIEIFFIPFSHPFNFSEKCNLGADVSTGEVIIFLNDDVVLKSENAVLELSGAAMLDNIGAVGSKLKFSNGVIQHGGILISNDSFGHAYFGKQDVPGIAGDLLVSHEVLGVTGACLALRRNLFHLVGMWNLELASSYNDVELCLKIRNEGFSNLILNNLDIEHFGSATRKSVTTNSDRVITNRVLVELEYEPYMRQVVNNNEELSTARRLIAKLIRVFQNLFK